MLVMARAVSSSAAASRRWEIVRTRWRGPALGMAGLSLLLVIFLKGMVCLLCRQAPASLGRRLRGPLAAGILSELLALPVRARRGLCPTPCRGPLSSAQAGGGGRADRGSRG